MIDDKLATWRLPYIDTSLDKIKHRIEAGILHLELGFPSDGIEAVLKQSLDKHLAAMGVTERFEIAISTKIALHRVQSQLKGLPGVKNIIAVASGKGGVGKSTVSANLAVSLSRLGAKVGLLDADIYGPSQPKMLGASTRPESVEGKYLKPVTCHGVETMSMGYLIEDESTAMVWRGPMVSKALQQLLFETLWGELDYLIIDLPPGTGDIQLTLCQKIPLAATIIVTTPQDIALLDVKKAITMFEKVRVPVLGIVENMSFHRCSACGFEEHIFGAAGAHKLAHEFNTVCLEEIPLNAAICAALDRGEPPALADDELGDIFKSLALKAASSLSLHAKNYAVKFPNITVEKG